MIIITTIIIKKSKFFTIIIIIIIKKLIDQNRTEHNFIFDLYMVHNHTNCYTTNIIQNI